MSEEQPELALAELRAQMDEALEAACVVVLAAGWSRERCCIAVTPGRFMTTLYVDVEPTPIGEPVKGVAVYEQFIEDKIEEGTLQVRLIGRWLVQPVPVPT